MVLGIKVVASEWQRGTSGLLVIITQECFVIIYEPEHLVVPACLSVYLCYKNFALKANDLKNILKIMMGVCVWKNS